MSMPDDADKRLPEERLLEELRNLRSTLDATLWKSDAPDMRNNLKAVRVSVEGRLRNLALRDESLAARLAHDRRECDSDSNSDSPEDVFEQSKRLLQLIDHCIAFRECYDA